MARERLARAGCSQFHQQAVHRLRQRAFIRAGYFPVKREPGRLLEIRGAFDELKIVRGVRLERETPQDILAEGMEGGGAQRMNGA